MIWIKLPWTHIVGNTWLWAYVPLCQYATREFGNSINRHPFLPKRAWLKFSKSWNPRPPAALGIHTHILEHENMKGCKYKYLITSVRARIWLSKDPWFFNFFHLNSIKLSIQGGICKDGSGWGQAVFELLKWTRRGVWWEWQCGFNF